MCITPDCQHRLCRKHCISKGGCTSKMHAGPCSAKTFTGPYSPSPPAATIQQVMFAFPRRHSHQQQLASSHDGKILTAFPPNVNMQMSPDVDILDTLPNPYNKDGWTILGVGHHLECIGLPLIVQLFSAWGPPWFTDSRCWGSATGAGKSSVVLCTTRDISRCWNIIMKYYKVQMCDHEQEIPMYRPQNSSPLE